MRSMDVALVFLIFLLQGLQATEAILLTELEDNDVKFTCVHSNAIGSIKYLCNRRCTDQDILVTSKKTFDEHNGKYKIEDRGNSFDVTISRLSLEDSGRYWCGIERGGIDTYTEVSIVVIKRPEDNDDGDGAQSSVSGLSSKKLVYIGASVGVVILALAIILLVFFWHRKRHISSSSENNKRESNCRCTIECSEDVSAPPPNPPPQLTAQQRDSALSSSPGDYVDVEAPECLCPYQQLDLSRLEDHVYHSLGNNRAKHGPAKETFTCQ